MMSKIKKYPTGTFLEIDDLVGGRKVVIVCRDGVTFWDMLDVKYVTPIVIHPSMNPQLLGSMAQFIIERHLQKEMLKVVYFLRQKTDMKSYHNPLFTMRVLWYISQKRKNDTFEVNSEILEWAYKQAHIQQNIAIRIHEYANKFYSEQSN